MANIICWTRSCILADTIGALQFIARDVAEEATAPRWCCAMDAGKDIISRAWIPRFGRCPPDRGNATSIKV